MSKEPILLVGAGGHAKSCIDVIEVEGRFEIAGIVSLPQELGSSVLGYEVLGVDDDLAGLRERYASALVTAGHIQDANLRLQLFTLLRRHNFNLPVVISPNAYVSQHARMGAGTIVMHGTVVNAGAVVGENCILNSQALIEHDALIGNHCHVSTSAIINGGVQIGMGCFVGSNSTVRQYLTIGERSFIGMGQHVIDDCKPGTRLSRFRSSA